MTRKFFLSLVALLALSEAGSAQVSGLNVGYCQGADGAFPPTTDEYFSAVSTKKQTWTSGAILLKPERVKSMAGNQIREIRAHLASRLNVDSLAVWVSEGLDGPVISSDTITSAVKGWNTVALTNVVDITSGMGTLCVGYSYHQKSTCKAMSCLADVSVPGYSCFVRSGNDGWKDYSGSYTQCVEAMVYGDNLPKYDLALEELDVQKNYVVDNGTLGITMRVRNNATATITGFDAVCAFDGIDETYTVHCDSVLKYGEAKTVNITVKPTAIQSMTPATRTVTVTIANLAEGDDEMPEDNTLSGTFGVTVHSFLRNVLLEEFTTEQCTQCPRVANYVHTAMTEPEFQGRLNTMENHAGYYTDQFTTEFHDSWLWFYDNVYAPGVVYDRTVLDGGITPVTSPANRDALFFIIRARMKQTAFVSLKIKADVDEENQLINVTVTGERAKEDFTINPPRITVVLTETNLAAISQAGAGTDYVHYNVGRRVNSTWGDVIDWNGDEYTYTCSIPYTKNYDMSNLGILAFVHDYDPEDKTKCEVANSAAITSAEFTGLTNGVGAVNAVGEKSKVYDITGRRLTGLRHGINIVEVNGKRNKVVID